MQIDTTISQNDAPALHKERMKSLVGDYMSSRENQKQIAGLVSKAKNRFDINLDDLRNFNPDLAKYVTKNPIEAISMFEQQLDRSVQDLKDENRKGVNSEKTATMQNAGDKAFPTKVKKYYVNFEGSFGKNHVTPRGLKANLVNQFVSVQGIVTRMAIVKPKIQTSVHYCDETKKGLIKHYTDDTNLAELAEDAVKVGDGRQNFPTEDANRNPLSTEYGYCVYKDYQMITIQEMPENAPPGQLPRSVQVILENDLVDKAKPGDRIEVNGVFRCKGSAMNGITNGIFQTHIVATGITSMLAEKSKPNLSESDIKSIRRIAQDGNVLELLSRSIAPTIEGKLEVKKGLLLQLLGGAEKTLPNGTHLRGDINVMMVGDPSTAKSQLLRHIMDIAPLAINTTGRGSTGVGLTAAVCVDKDTGERHLEAGAMVLADRGIVCIDEFDKMNDNDRVAIHEVMEQQTVTIAKAGIHCSLNARCSVIAAANPIYGDYARDQSVAKNIGLPDSLLSRFDLLFVMLDEKEPDADRRIAERVITNHRFQGGQNLMHFFNDDTIIETAIDHGGNAQDGKGTTVYDKEMSGGAKSGQQVVTREFLKKYISFVKSQNDPELTDDSLSLCSALYAGLRQKATNHDQDKVSVPVTVRTLETMIRLATAHSKLRASKTVEMSDVDIAYYMLKASIFNEQMEKKQEPIKADEEMEDESEEVIPTSRSRARNKRERPTDLAQPPADEDTKNKKMKVDHVEQVTQLFSSNTIAPVHDVFQKKLVFKLLSQLKDSQNKVSIDKIWAKYLTTNERETMRKGTNEPLVNNKDELIAIVESLERDDLLMYASEENQVILM